MIRLAWSARPERLETCRRQSDEELEQLPPHMRQRVVCEGATARYRLELHRDGIVQLDEVVRGGGARHDRPMYVLREFPVPPGSARLEVRFSRIDRPATPPDSAAEATRGTGPDTVLPAARERREAEERERRRREAIPPLLALDIRVELKPRQVVLVTYDLERRTLVVASPGRTP